MSGLWAEAVPDILLSLAVFISMLTYLLLPPMLRLRRKRAEQPVKDQAQMR